MSDCLMMKSLMPPEQYAAWQRQQEASKKFWRILQGPAQRPLGSNADEWNLFVDENKKTPAFLAVQIAEAIEEAEKRGQAIARSEARLNRLEQLGFKDAADDARNSE